MIVLTSLDSNKIFGTCKEKILHPCSELPDYIAGDYCNQKTNYVLIVRPKIAIHKCNLGCYKNPKHFGKGVCRLGFGKYRIEKELLANSIDSNDSNDSNF